MRQTLMDFIRCTGKWKSGKQCSYAAKYGPWCGHHRTETRLARCCTTRWAQYEGLQIFKAALVHHGLVKERSR